MTTLAERIPPQVPSLPTWPEQPEPVDTAGSSFLVFALGGDPATAAVARAWVEEAEGIGPTTLGVVDRIDCPEDLATVESLVDRARTGVRVMIVGGQFDILQALAVLRRRGALDSEVRRFVTDFTEIPVFCAHCQTIFRAVTMPGGASTCTTCARPLEVHEHLASQLGAFLASYSGERP
ncbi:dimethylamine monooxygenase subunit DmmA family protein [Nocardioides sp.]|uniref:dimethylamine monooxygenase subunit DmmA family protein n=1 Tax=Nocardioides sp. TaxID=35761 RepID=UPI0039E63712